MDNLLYINSSCGGLIFVYQIPLMLTDTCENTGRLLKMYLEKILYLEK